MAGERTSAGKQKSRDGLTPIPQSGAQRTAANVRSGNMTARQGIRSLRGGD